MSILPAQLHGSRIGRFQLIIAITLNDMKKDWPSTGEFVICTVNQLDELGVKVSLEDYPGKEGLIPRPEVAAGWIKRVRDYVKPGQKVVAKVLNVDPERARIDLSLRLVSELQKRQLLRHWMNERKACSWIRKLGIDPDSIRSKLLDRFEGIHPALQAAASGAQDFFQKLGFDPELSEKLYQLALQKFKPAQVEISGILELRCFLPDGVEHIKHVLSMALQRFNTDQLKLRINYLGAPRYQLKLTAPSYKQAEAALDQLLAQLEQYLRSHAGELSFKR